MTATSTHFFLQDANFNVTAAVDDATNAVVERYAYTPYGEVTVLDPNFPADADGASDIGNTHLYTGRERDPETGLQLNRRRYYISRIGRWLTRDPSSYEGSPWNLYEYIYSEPVNGFDSSGLMPIFPPLRSIPCGHVSIAYNLLNLKIEKIKGVCYGQIPDARVIERLINKLIGAFDAKTISYRCELGGYCCNLRPFKKRFRQNFTLIGTYQLIGPDCTVKISGTIAGSITGEIGTCQDSPCN